eukprot:m.485493 g.485493  ORF g.485493 m.485493 type:complete len:267 (+) comp23849_c0_seq1:192-992(+)
MTDAVAALTEATAELTTILESAKHPAKETGWALSELSTAVSDVPADVLAAWFGVHAPSVVEAKDRADQAMTQLMEMQQEFQTTRDVSASKSDKGAAAAIGQLQASLSQVRKHLVQPGWPGAHWISCLVDVAEGGSSKPSAVALALAGVEGEGAATADAPGAAVTTALQTACVDVRSLEGDATALKTATKALKKAQSAIVEGDGKLKSGFVEKKVRPALDKADASLARGLSLLSHDTTALGAARALLFVIARIQLKLAPTSDKNQDA